jgi:hypothetical protein
MTSATIDTAIDGDILNLLNTTDLPGGIVAPATSQPPEAMPPIAALSMRTVEPKKVATGLVGRGSGRILGLGWMALRCIW